MILVFDLDDTLYDEKNFLKSGMFAVVEYLHNNCGISCTDGRLYVEQRLRFERKHAIDDLLKNFGLYSKRNVRTCLGVYRTHKPDIQLYPEAEVCLKRFSQYRKYIVTDGNKVVQHNKVTTLGLYSQVDFVYITHRYGLIHAKPSPYCFNKICAAEKVNPNEVVYIADNPKKDFVGIKPLGFKTVRILQGPYKDLRKDPRFEADINIESLEELDDRFISSLISI